MNGVMAMRTLFAILLAMVVTSACANGLERNRDPLAQYDGYIGEPVRSFTAFRVQSWQPVDTNQLILWTGVNDAYLIKVEGYCPDLPYANTVSVDNKTSQISTLDSIIVKGDRCRIKQINPIDVKTMKADRKLNEKPK